MNKLKLTTVSLVLGLLYVSTFASDPPEKFNIHWTLIPSHMSYDQNYYNGSRLLKSTETDLTVPISQTKSVGKSFYHQHFSSELGINQLTRQVTMDNLERRLLGSTGRTVSFYQISYTQSPPFVESTYLQFITDPSWNRIVYGNLNHWIRSYSAIETPVDIAVDPGGRLYIAEKKPQRISVLQIKGSGEDVRIEPHFQITGFTEPTDLAHSDNGSPRNNSDDMIYVADASQNRIYKYRLGESSAALDYYFEDVETPTVIMVGKFNGSNINHIYIIDHYSRRITLYRDTGGTLEKLTSYDSPSDRYFTSLTCDHFGNLYVTDHIHSELLKFSPSLEFLDSYSGNQRFTSLHSVDIPFGLVTIEGDGSYWVGFDQLFALEQWTDESGAQRARIAAQMKDVTFYTDTRNSQIGAAFMLTDAARMTFSVKDESDKNVYAMPEHFMLAGTKQLSWDRRDDSHSFVKSGTYTFNLSATSPYTDETIEIVEHFFLPAYFWQDCGNSDPGYDDHRSQGESFIYGDGPLESAAQHDQSVIYTFENLDTESRYKIDVDYLASFNGSSIQNLTVNGIELHRPLRLSQNLTSLRDLELPPASYAHGVVSLQINRFGEGPATISQLWLRETGRDIAVQSPGSDIPASFALEQNFPNPFNPTTQITFQLPQAGDINLKIYDVLGRLVDQLIDGYKSAGRHTVIFDARQLSSGVYIYQIRTGNFTESRKMLLIR